jgi:hypothetical protein
MQRLGKRHTKVSVHPLPPVSLDVIALMVSSCGHERGQIQIGHIDFLKVDCEGGEGFIFREDNAAFFRTHVHKIASLNLSGFVDGCSWSIKTGLHRSKTRRFPPYGLGNNTA